MAKKKKKSMKEQPFKPEVDTGIEKPVRGMLAVGDVNDKYSTYPSNGLTPRRLARIFRAADGGDVFEQMELFEEMEEKDTHLFSQLQTRKLAVTGLDWEVQPFSDDERDKEIAEFINEQLKGIENLDAIFIDMLDAIGKGVSVMEIEWGLDSNLANIIENIEYVYPKKLIWDFQTDEMKICTKEFPSGMSLPENKFVVHKYKAKSGHTSRAGILRVVSWMYLFKNYDVKDWVAFCEVFGMPLRLGKYNAAASDDDKKALMEAIYSLGTDAAGIIPDSTIIEFIESQKTTSVEIYEKLARYCDEQISKAVLGQTLSSDSGGSYAQGKTKKDFMDTMNDFLERNGYEGLNPFNADVIFRTNMQTAYNAGHYKSMTNPTTKKLRPFWKYITAGDGEVRESHAQMEGRIYPADDPIWDIWYPPNGFRCRCTVVSLTKSQAEREKEHISKGLPYNVDHSTGEILYQFPDKGFSNNPAKDSWKPDLTGIDSNLKSAFRERQQKNNAKTG